jgi:hypothetical protein
MGVPVVDLTFTLAEVTSLAQKLSQVQNLQDSLTAEEYDLLLAIFAAAAARAKVINEVNQTSTLPEAEVSGQAKPPIAGVTPELLQEQLIKAYIPGNYFNAVAEISHSTIGEKSPSAQAKEPTADEGGQ